MESLNPLCNALYTYAMEYRAAAFLAGLSIGLELGALGHGM